MTLWYNKMSTVFIVIGQYVFNPCPWQDDCGRNPKGGARYNG